MGSFSIREAVMIIALMAIAFAAAAQNSYGLVSLFSLLLLLYLSFNSLQAVVGVGKRRIKAIGVCVFGWSFIGATTLPFVRPENLVYSAVVALGVGVEKIDLLGAVGAKLLCLAFMFVGGLLTPLAVASDRERVDRDGEAEPESTKRSVR